MTEGEKALQELGYELNSNSSEYSNEYEIEYVNDDYCISYYGWHIDRKVFLYTVSAFICDTSEPIDLNEDLLKAMLLRLRELNAEVQDA